jgi:hypothetical protein
MNINNHFLSSLSGAVYYRDEIPRIRTQIPANPVARRELKPLLLTRHSARSIYVCQQQEGDEENPQLMPGYFNILAAKDASVERRLAVCGVSPFSGQSEGSFHFNIRVRRPLVKLSAL